MIAQQCVQGVGKRCEILMFFPVFNPVLYTYYNVLHIGYECMYKCINTIQLLCEISVEW